MADCSKRLLDLSLGDAYACFVNAEDWKVVAGNLRRMWANFTGTSIGEWIGIILAFAVLPAQLASYVLPPIFLFRLIGRYRTPPPIASARAKRKQVAWGLYLIAAGLLKLGMGQTDNFMFYQGTWEITCGGLVLALGPSWWVTGAEAQKTASR